MNYPTKLYSNLVIAGIKVTTVIKTIKIRIGFFAAIFLECSYFPLFFPVIKYV